MKVQHFPFCVILAGSGVLLSHAALAAQVEVYGVIDTSLLFQTHSPDFESNPSVASRSTLEMKSGHNKGSRWGLRGTEKLTEDLSVQFILENGFSSETGAILFGDRLFGRQTTLALKSRTYGELAFGRMGALNSGAGNYALTSWITPFDTGLGNWSTASSNYMFGYQRLDNAVIYISPKFAGWTFHAQYSFSADLKVDHDSAEDGIQFGTEGLSSADRYLGLAVAYKNKPIDFAAVVDSYNWSSDIARNEYRGVVNDFDDSLAVTAGGSYDFGWLKAYAGAQWFKNGWKNWMGGGLFKINAAGDTQGPRGLDRFVDGWSIVGGVDFDWGPGRTGIGVAYGDYHSSHKEDDSKGRRWGVSLHYTYPLSKTTTLYWIGSYMHDEHSNLYDAAHQRIGNKDKIEAFENAIGLYMWF